MHDRSALAVSWRALTEDVTPIASGGGGFQEVWHLRSQPRCNATISTEVEDLRRRWNHDRTKRTNRCIHHNTLITWICDIFDPFQGSVKSKI